MMRSHEALTQALELRYKFEEAIPQFSVPKKHRYLTIDAAKWCVDKIHVFNQDNHHIKYIIRLCEQFIDLHTQITAEAKKALKV